MLQTSWQHHEIKITDFTKDKNHTSLVFSFSPRRQQPSYPFVNYCLKPEYFSRIKSIGISDGIHVGIWAPPNSAPNSDMQVLPYSVPDGPFMRLLTTLRFNGCTLILTARAGNQFHFPHTSVERSFYKINFTPFGLFFLSVKKVHVPIIVTGHRITIFTPNELWDVVDADHVAN